MNRYPERIYLRRVARHLTTPTIQPTPLMQPQPLVSCQLSATDGRRTAVSA